MSRGFVVVPRRPGADAAILHLFARELPQDRIGWRRWHNGTLMDPNFCTEGCLVALDQGRVVGVIVVSRAVEGISHLGVMAVDRAYRRRGIGLSLWQRARGWCGEAGAHTILADGMLPHLFIPGIDEKAHEGAGSALKRWGFTPEPSVWSMHRDLDTWEHLKTERWIREGLTIGPIPPAYRHDLLRFADEEFGSGWTRAARETWIRASRLPKVLGIYDDQNVWGMTVVGGYGEPLGRLGPIGVGKALRGRGWGSLLLRYSLSYMASHGVQRAFFLHCNEGTAAYQMYLRNGFEPDRRFVPHRYRFDGGTTHTGL